MHGATLKKKYLIHFTTVCTVSAIHHHKHLLFMLTS